MRRAAVSIPSNIAEGAGDKEFLKFLSVARGSLSELETQFLLAKELNYLKDEKRLIEKIATVFRLLGGLMKSVQARSNS